MKWYIKSIILLIIVVGYLVLINNIDVVFNRVNSEDSNFSPFTILNGGTTQVGVSDNVEISIVRPRWYGTILEKETESILYLFEFIKIPLKIKGINLLYLHMFFIILFIFTIYIMVILKKDKKEVVIDVEKLD